jgi:hypothetical protein
MVSPEPVTDERNMSDKDKTKFAKIENPGDWCILRMAFTAENNSSTGRLLMSNFVSYIRLFWD